MRYYKWTELKSKEKEQVIKTYISIRAEEEEIHESNVDWTGVKNCYFIKTDNDYLEVEV